MKVLLTPNRLHRLISNIKKWVNNRISDAVLTVKQGGTVKGTFSANASSPVTIELDSGAVNSVNGIEPDENGNVEIQGADIKFSESQTVRGAISDTQGSLGILSNFVNTDLTGRVTYAVSVADNAYSMASTASAKATQLESSKIDKVSGAVAGNIAVFDANGNTVDGGNKFSPVAKTERMIRPVGIDANGKLWTSEESDTKRFGVVGVGKSSTTLTRIWDAVGFQASPSTDTVEGYSDFDDFAPFNRKKCVGSWSLVDDKAVFTPQAYYGDADYAEDGTMGDYVAIDVTPFFWYHDNNSGTFAVSEGWHSGWEYHPVCLDADGKPREHTYLPAYELGMVNGKPVSLPGCHPEFGAYKALWDKCRLYGDGGNIKNKCIMEPSDVNHYNWLLMTIEFATTNMQTIMQGATSMRYSSDVIQLSGTDVNFVVLTGSVGDNYVVGQSIYIGSSYGDTPSDVGAYNVITAIEKCDSDGTLNPSGTYRKITFDGTARTVTAASTQIGSRPWITGSTNSVLGHTGSPVSNSDSKHPCKYRWLENPYGSINKTCIDLMDARVADGDSYKLRWYYNSEYKHNGATATSNPSSESAFTEAAGWHLLSVETDKEHYVNGYIKELSADDDYPTVFVPTNTTGGSATTYYADYAALVHSSAMRAVRRGGALSNGAYSGPCYFSASAAPAYSPWSYGAGLFFAQG